MVGVRLRVPSSLATLPSPQPQALNVLLVVFLLVKHPELVSLREEENDDLVQSRNPPFDISLSFLFLSSCSLSSSACLCACCQFLSDFSRLLYALLFFSFPSVPRVLYLLQFWSFIWFSAFSLFYFFFAGVFSLFSASASFSFILASHALFFLQFSRAFLFGAGVACSAFFAACSRVLFVKLFYSLRFPLLHALFFALCLSFLRFMTVCASGIFCSCFWLFLLYGRSFGSACILFLLFASG
ncbi:uncharacterized protein LOC129293097 [Prosopis cineraria]|uniref:uncharacterized protein LOC129293097 n=1 Tax=Prosopis cineraria TaxID=364024 RepID=UPI0024105EDA|nr:uncharacterized protein LOC129293097 [Prosopis cineraria]